MKIIPNPTLINQKDCLDLPLYGADFVFLTTMWNDISTSCQELLFRNFDTICDVGTRYVRYHAYLSPKRGFLFLDEVIVN